MELQTDGYKDFETVLTPAKFRVNFVIDKVDNLFLIYCKF